MLHPDPNVISFSKAGTSVIYISHICGVCDGVKTPFFSLEEPFYPKFATHSPLCKNMIITAA